MRRAFLLGVLVAVAAEAVAAAIVIASGVVDVAATRHRAIPDRLLAFASTRAIAHHARDDVNPLAHDPAALKAGLQHYREMCVACHGGPGAAPEEFAAGLHPPPPDLASPEVQTFTDGMLYETIAGGIGSTGMPAFGPTHRPADLWSIVAFVRHLPALTPDERRELGREHTGGAHEAAAPAPAAGETRAGGEASGGGAARGQRVQVVSMSSFKFVPQELTVHAGDTIEWKNADFVAHTATATEGTFDTGRIDTGGAKRVVVTKKGRFPYFCRYHAAMKGTLVVE